MDHATLYNVLFSVYAHIIIILGVNSIIYTQESSTYCLLFTSAGQTKREDMSGCRKHPIQDTYVQEVLYCVQEAVGAKFYQAELYIVHTVLVHVATFE